jgi:hypothetical protein
MFDIFCQEKWCKLHLGSNDEGNVSVITDIFCFVVYNENTLFIYHEVGTGFEYDQRRHTFFSIYQFFLKVHIIHS